MPSAALISQIIIAALTASFTVGGVWYSVGALKTSVEEVRTDVKALSNRVGHLEINVGILMERTRP